MCILVVDDEPEIRWLATKVLTKAGHRVISAEDALQAMQLLLAQHDEFTCLVSDFHMGIGPNGSELIEMVREVYPTLPCILVTAQPDVVPYGWRAKTEVGLVVKPFRASHLLAAVQAHLPTGLPGLSSAQYASA